jgi:CheY-like chemotaxis protein
MDGSIGVDSTPGAGSSFWFEIASALAPDEQAAAPNEPGSSEAGPRAPTRSARVLVADDVATNRRLIEAILSHLGHGGAFVENGRQAVEAVRRERFDVILMDMQMPEMDGIEATRAIRALSGLAGRTPIIALTADAVIDRRDQFEAAGIDGILLKPIHWNELQSAIDAVLR